MSVQIPMSEKAMGVVSSIGRFAAIDNVLNKTGLWNKVKGTAISHFEEPELLDDLLDHWTSDFHVKVCSLRSFSLFVLLCAAGTGKTWDAAFQILPKKQLQYLHIGVPTVPHS